MKYLFPTILLVSLFCVTSNVAAKTQPESQATIIEKIKNALGLSSNPKTSKTPTSTTQNASANTNAIVAFKSMQDIINETTNKDDRAKFGIAAMIKAFREQAANTSNPQKNLFAQDLPVWEELFKIQGNDFKQATILVEKLTPETKQLLKNAIEARYSVFTKLIALKDFFLARQVPA